MKLNNETNNDETFSRPPAWSRVLQNLPMPRPIAENTMFEAECSYFLTLTQF